MSEDFFFGREGTFEGAEKLGIVGKDFQGGVAIDVVTRADLVVRRAVHLGHEHWDAFLNLFFFVARGHGKVHE